MCVLLAGFVIRGSNAPSAGDTIALVHGARQISYCLGHGILTKCDDIAPWTGLDGVSTEVINGRVIGDVGPYPLYQYVPAWIAVQFGFSDFSVYKILDLVNTGALIMTLWLTCWLACKTRQRWSPAVLALVLSTSPLLVYASLTFGESLAIFLMVLFAVACLRRWHPAVIGLCAIAACLTKETVFPVILLTGASALVGTPVGLRTLRRGHWVGLGIGTAAGVIVGTLFDVFRWDQLTNFDYLQSYEQVKTLHQEVRQALGVWLAPNAGLAPFWILAALLVVGLVVWTIRRPGLRSRLIGAAIIIALLELTATLAKWWAPFGWDAWGPRLMLPVIAEVVVTVVFLYGHEIASVLSLLLRRRWFAALVGVLIVAAALPAVNVLHAQQAIGGGFTADATCPQGLPSVFSPGYYHCLNHYAWRTHLFELRTFAAWSRPWGVIFGLVFAASWLTLYANALTGASVTVAESAPGPDTEPAAV